MQQEGHWLTGRRAAVPFFSRLYFLEPVQGGKPRAGESRRFVSCLLQQLGHGPRHQQLVRQVQVATEGPAQVPPGLLSTAPAPVPSSAVIGAGAAVVAANRGLAVGVPVVYLGHACSHSFWVRKKKGLSMGTLHLFFQSKISNLDEFQFIL